MRRQENLKDIRGLQEWVLYEVTTPVLTVSVGYMLVGWSFWLNR